MYILVRKIMRFFLYKAQEFATVIYSLHFMYAYSLECIIQLFLGYFVLHDNSITIDCLSAPVISSSFAKYNSSRH